MTAGLALVGSQTFLRMTGKALEGLFLKGDE
jgi:hypothetical protein